MLRRLCILDLSKHQAAIQGDYDSRQTSAMPTFTRPAFSAKTYTIVNELVLNDL